VKGRLSVKVKLQTIHNDWIPPMFLFFHVTHISNNPGLLDLALEVHGLGLDFLGLGNCFLQVSYKIVGKLFQVTILFFKSSSVLMTITKH